MSPLSGQVLVTEEPWEARLPGRPPSGVEQPPRPQALNGRGQWLRFHLIALYYLPCTVLLVLRNGEFIGLGLAPGPQLHGGQSYFLSIDSRNVACLR